MFYFSVLVSTAGVGSALFGLDPALGNRL